MTPGIILVAKSSAARRRAQQALMDAGGRFGFHWNFCPIYDGGMFMADPADEHREAVHGRLAHWLRERGRLALGEAWLVNAWRQPLTPEQMENMNAWRSQQLRLSRELL